MAVPYPSFLVTQEKSRPGPPDRRAGDHLDVRGGVLTFDAGRNPVATAVGRAERPMTGNRAVGALVGSKVGRVGDGENLAAILVLGQSGVGGIPSLGGVVGAKHPVGQRRGQGGAVARKIRRGRNRGDLGLYSPESAPAPVHAAERHEPADSGGGGEQPRRGSRLKGDRQVLNEGTLQPLIGNRPGPTVVGRGVHARHGAGVKNPFGAGAGSGDDRRYGTAALTANALPGVGGYGD